MPLFFFISGFFVYSRNYSMDLFKKRAKNRIVRQLYPTILVCLVCCAIFFEGDIVETAYHPYKRGYWFTITAVQMFFIAIPILLILNKYHSIPERFNSIIIIVYTFIVETAVWLIMRNMSCDNVSLTGIEQFVLFFPYFMGGMLLKINYEKILTVITNKYLAIGCFVCFAVCFCIFNNTLNKFILGFSAIIVMHYIAFRAFKYDRIIKSKISKALQYVGTMTLEIYLLHFFFIYTIRYLTNPYWLSQQINTPWELPLFLLISVVVAALCLGVVFLMKKLRIYGIFFPSINNKKVIQKAESYN